MRPIINFYMTNGVIAANRIKIDPSQSSCQKWVGKNVFWLLFHYMQLSAVNIISFSP